MNVVYITLITKQGLLEKLTWKILTGDKLENSHIVKKIVSTMCKTVSVK